MISKIKSPQYLLLSVLTVACVVILLCNTGSRRTTPEVHRRHGSVAGHEPQFAKHMAYTCRRNNMSSDSMTLSDDVMSRLYVDDAHRTIGCVINKAGCSTWKYIMMRATGKIPKGTTKDGARVHNRALMYTYGIKSLSNYTLAESQYRIHNYYKFIVVRQPYERLYSAYREKFAILDWNYHMNVGRKIISKFRVNATLADKKSGGNVKFTEFVDYLISGLTRFNIHWMSYVEFCDPCRVKYDKVVRLENVEEDSTEVLDILGTSSLGVPHMNTNRRVKVNSIAEPFSLLTKSQYHKLWKIYGVDFKMFGFTWEDDKNSGECECCR